MKVAITGATGFVGRHVLLELMQCDVDIVIITRDARKIGEVHKSKFNNPIQILEADIYAELDYYKMKCVPDVLIHLAWEGLPNYKSLHHFETELPKQYNFIKSMVDAGLKSIFVSGTCFEYGMQSGALSANTKTDPTNPYGYAKDCLRKQLEFLKQVKPFNLIWGRLFYMYGEGQASSSLYPQLKQAILRGDEVFNMSGGEQIRDYLPVAAVAKRIVSFSLSEKDVGCVNISSGSPVSVRAMVERWMQDNNWNINLNLGYYPYPDYEPMEFWGI